MDKQLETRYRCINRYNNLRDNFLKIASLHVTDDKLNELKLFYDKIINSKRETDRINDVIGLLKILERRAVLSFKSIEPIKYISDEFIKDPCLNQQIQNYLQDLSINETANAFVDFNIYKSQSGKNFNININNNNNLTLSNDDEKLLLNETTINDNTNNNFHKNKSSIIDVSSSSSSSLCDLKNLRHYYHENKLLIIFIISILALSIFSLVTIDSISNKLSVLEPTASATTATSTSSNLTNKTHNTFLFPSHPTTTTTTTTTTTIIPKVMQSIAPYYVKNQNDFDSQSGQSIDLQNKVFEILSENLGRYWTEVARFLDIKEGEIDRIHQNKNFGFKEKSIEVFKLFKSRRGAYNNWQQILIRALNDARRKDLVYLVEELIMNEK
ncbi:hypothetical protein HCN44_008921 [Aphidius gifuensis]|uniref:Death domain-containing protein n=1 Tax=Aphidius gifuensis TaxID=684658 RepID=A0A835CSS1_APHGI|nr:hypothetical protein HCN44_008921 [Aphidius gifuensis]